MNKKKKFLCILIMGVSGTGKSTIGALLAKKLKWEFFEADDYHSEININKMKSGKPLNDHDRQPWLLRIKAEMLVRMESQNLVIACSALKEKYRSYLDPKNYKLIYLKVDKKTARRRIRRRKGHFMPESLLESQFSILEEPLNAPTFDQTQEQEEIVNLIIKNLKDEHS